jgi:hypothetical protein
MERISEKKTITIQGDFFPTAQLGDTVRPGTVIGSAKIPEIREEYPLQKGSDILVDDGMFVSAQTPLFAKRKGFGKEVIGSVHEGIVRVHRDLLRVVAEDEEEHEVKSPFWGKIVSISEDSYTVEVKRLKMPIFLSSGFRVEGIIHPILDKGLLVNQAHISAVVEGKIVLLPGALTYDTYVALMEYGVLGILAPSIDWGDYLKIFASANPNVGILHGFGMFPLWQWHRHLFSKLTDVMIEVDFATSEAFIPLSDILLSGIEHDLMLFKEYWWGKQVYELHHESGSLIARLETGEQAPVLPEELFNIR